jgi:hypothetical protein
MCCNARGLRVYDAAELGWVDAVRARHSCTGCMCGFDRWALCRACEGHIQAQEPIAAEGEMLRYTAERASGVPMCVCNALQGVHVVQPLSYTVQIRVHRCLQTEHHCHSCWSQVRTFRASRCWVHTSTHTLPLRLSVTIVRWSVSYRKPLQVMSAQA